MDFDVRQYSLQKRPLGDIPGADQLQQVISRIEQMLKMLAGDSGDGGASDITGITRTTGTGVTGLTTGSASVSTGSASLSPTTGTVVTDVVWDSGTCQMTKTTDTFVKSISGTFLTSASGTFLTSASASGTDTFTKKTTVNTTGGSFTTP